MSHLSGSFLSHFGIVGLLLQLQDPGGFSSQLAFQVINLNPPPLQLLLRLCMAALHALQLLLLSQSHPKFACHMPKLLTQGTIAHLIAYHVNEALLQDTYDSILKGHL